MSFLEDIKEITKEYGNSFSGYEIIYDIMPSNYDLSPITVIAMGTTRWEEVQLAVFERNDELVGVEFMSGLTEYQDDEAWVYGGRVYHVEPFTVTRYRRVKK